LVNQMVLRDVRQPYNVSTLKLYNKISIARG